MYCKSAKYRRINTYFGLGVVKCRDIENDIELITTMLKHHTWLNRSTQGRRVHYGG